MAFLLYLYWPRLADVTHEYAQWVFLDECDVFDMTYRSSSHTHMHLSLSLSLSLSLFCHHSWGDKWGSEGGYFQMIRGKNKCGITTGVTVPIV